MSSPTTFELSMSLFCRSMNSGPFAGTSAAVVFGASVGVVAAGGVIVGFALVSVSLAFWAMAVALARATVAAAARKHVRMGSTPLGLRSPETRMRWESSRREVQTSLRGLLRNRRSTLELKAKAESEL